MFGQFHETLNVPDKCDVFVWTADLKSLSLTGMRVGPLDEKTKAPVVGLVQEPVKHNPNQQTVFVKKPLSGFAAGFKIPEEYR